jgi:hypothetical protein
MEDNRSQKKIHTQSKGKDTNLIMQKREVYSTNTAAEKTG